MKINQTAQLQNSRFGLQKEKTLGFCQNWRCPTNKALTSGEHQRGQGVPGQTGLE